MDTSNWLRRLLVVLGIVAAGIWDEVVFAAAPIYLTTRWGGVAAFLVLTPTYAVLGSVITIGLIGRRRGKYARPTRFQLLLARWGANTEGSGIRRRLVAGGLVGFLLSSWLLGGILTCWILHTIGMRRHRVQAFVAANVIWAVTFVGQYTGLTALVLALFR